MRRSIGLCFLLLVIALGLGYFLAPRFFQLARRRATEPSIDNEKTAPRIIFKNTGPDVPYVGDQVCSGCHLSQADSYRHHPMGKSFAPVADIVPEERFGKENHNPFEALGFQFLVKPRPPHPHPLSPPSGGRGQGEGGFGNVFHQQVLRDAKGQVVLEREDQVHYVLGSGSQGRAYLMERDGFLFESPISWFSQKQIWDLSPGFDELFLAGRGVSGNCLFCHCNHANPVKDSLNHYRKPIFDGYAIGCERCHGPGKLHVEKQKRGDPDQGVDDTIVNPARLPPALREAVCQQCHLIGKERVLARGRQPSDYRPGLPLQEYWAVFVQSARLTRNSEAVGQVEQMYASRCFRGSNRDLGCISCHDPHSLPPEKEKVAYFRQRCLQCHHDKGCSASTADRSKTRPADNCIQCHMPRFATADIAHTASTDHRIRKRPDKSLPETSSASPGQMPLVNFFQDLLDPGDGRPKRDLGVALVNYAAVNPQFGRSTAQTALRLLDGSLALVPNDVAALEAQGKALWILDQREQARAAYEKALAIAPKRETALRSAGLLAFEMDEFDVAVAHFKTAQKVNPWDFANHFYLGQLYSKHEKWAEAVQELQAAVRLHPADSDSHRFLALCWVHSGDLEKARRELELAIALMPTDDGKLRRWFDDLVKEQKSESKK